MSQALEFTLTAEARQSLALTVYNTDLALIRDTRILRLPQGVARLAFADVSAQIRAETARLYGELTVLEQNFDYDLLTPQKLLEKYVGREVGLIRSHPETGEETLERGTLLSVAEGGAVFRFDQRIETFGPKTPWRFVFDEVPENLRERPTLTMLVQSTNDQERTVELAYLSGGLSWQADYVATVQGEAMDLTGWVTLSNHSGVGYPEARLQLLAGDVRQVAPPPMKRALEETMMAQAAPAMDREALFEYHLYTLERPTTLADNQTKQVLLMQAEGVPVTRVYRVEANPYGPFTRQRDEEELPVQVRLEFINASPALGEPLPAGVVRFYQRDSAGQTQFIGEDRINHTPEGRRVELTLGNAFDVTATRRQTDFRRLGEREQEAAWEVTLYNAKAEPVQVQVAAAFPGEWRILEESAPHKRESAATALWTVSVPAKGTMLLKYRVWMR
ncbi:MAG: DUF4139 domain-containing protein [Pseudomonadota bacterium]|nr:DUF4139 domain-containing protein [Pseudomonadota bacterium]